MAKLRVGGRAPSSPRLKCRFQILVAVTLVFMISVSFLILQPDVFNRSGQQDLDDLDRKPADPEERVVVNRIDLAPSEGKLKSDGIAGAMTVEKIIQQLVEKYRVDFGAETGPVESVWETAAGWVSSRQVLPESAPELGAVLHAMATAPIIAVDTGIKGTQLKLSMKLAGGQLVVFKPKWYERDYIVEGPPYAGRDRHNAEIAAFHLSRILNMRRTPLAVGRTISISRDLVPVASSELLQTFYENTDGSVCFYGKCLYCNKENSLCTQGDSLEGTVILWMPSHVRLKSGKNPWRRTYRENVIARWEKDPQYCSKVRHADPFRNNTGLLLDLIDTAVFDFLMGNADRHHYEVVSGVDKGMLVMLDNGKSFGNPDHDEHSILAPLYHCCSIRYSTWQKLQMLRDGTLSAVLREVMYPEYVAPVLTPPHLKAMDRRLEKVLLEVEQCIEENGLKSVIF